MRSQSFRAGLVLAMMYIVVLAMVAGCQSVPKANAAATSDTQATLQPFLKEVAQKHPDQATAVNTLLANWSAQSERADYAAAKPLLAYEVADHPELADAINDKLWSWDKRLTAMGQ